MYSANNSVLCGLWCRPCAWAGGGEVVCLGLSSAVLLANCCLCDALLHNMYVHSHVLYTLSPSSYMYTARLWNVDKVVSHVILVYVGTRQFCIWSDWMSVFCLGVSPWKVPPFTVYSALCGLPGEDVSLTLS